MKISKTQLNKKIKKGGANANPNANAGVPVNFEIVRRRLLESRNFMTNGLASRDFLDMMNFITDPNYSRFLILNSLGGKYRTN